MIDKKNGEEIADFQECLLAWFQASQRPLPWRTTYTPYHVWISEIMGQQTQMDRVSLYFSRWIEQFPDIAAVAAAPEQAILKAWEGLGYYSRARNLQRAARLVVSDFQAVLPASKAELERLPGVGRYTAAAIVSIAFGHVEATLDGNIRRVLSRFYNIELPSGSP